MLILIYFTLLTFFQDYQHFVDTRKADQLLVEFGRDTTNYAILENDPVKIWFIRNHFPNEKIESLMVATRPFPRQPEISSVLRYEALRANDYKTKIRKLKQAWQLDPYAFDNFLSLLALSLKLKEKILAQETLLNLPEIIKDFQVQVLLLTNVILVIYLVLIGLGFLYIAVQLYRYFPLFAHRLGFLNHGLKDFVGAALLLTPLILFLNIYLLVVIYSVFLLLILNGRARNWLRLFLVLILFSLPLSYPLSIFADFLQRRARTYELYSYLKITYPEPKMKFTRPDELFIAAYSLKKRNLLEGAQALYENLLPHASNSYAVLNNAANALCALRKFSVGESLYQKAIRLAPHRGEAHFNLGWCYLKELKFYEASKEIDKAKTLNFTPPVEDYYDIPPDESFFWKSLLSEKPRLSLIFSIKFLIPILLVLFFSYLIKPISPPHYCSLCGRPICSKCSAVAGEDIYCNNCWSIISRPKDEKYETSIQEQIQAKRQLVEKIKIIGLTILLPGLGHYYKERILTGGLLAFLPVTFYILYFFNGYLIKPAYWVPQPLVGLITIVGLPIVALCYIIAFISILRS